MECELFFKNDLDFLLKQKEEKHFFSKEEEKSKLSILNEKKREEWMLGRIAAKKAALKYLKKRKNTKASFKSIIVRQEQGGMPFFHFNFKSKVSLSLSISHAFEIAFAAVEASREGIIGVDIEKVRSFKSKTIAAFLSKNEIRQLQKEKIIHRNFSITGYWSLKEAFLKALGCGLRKHPKTINIISCGENLFFLSEKRGKSGMGKLLSITSNASNFFVCALVKIPKI